MNINIAKPFRELGNAFKELLFPAVCLHCHQLITPPADIPIICPRCLGSLTPLPDGFAQINILNRLHPCYIEDLLIAFEFHEVIRLMLHGVKYQKMPRLGERIGKLAGETLREKLAALRGILVLPVPLHIVRKKEREFNQSSCIARGIFREEKAVIMEDLLLRKRYTSSQTKLNRMRRQRNVKDAFALTEKSLLQGRVVALVDDVVTTGATMNECARLLKLNGAARVVGAALATPVQGT